MSLNSFDFSKPQWVAWLLALIIGLISSACNATGLIPVTGISTPAGNISANAPNSAGNAAPIRGNKAQGKPDCQAVGDAFTDFERSYPTLGIIGNGSYTERNTPDSLFYVDFVKLRSEYDILDTLPDSPSFGKTSDAIAQFRQATDLIEKNLKSGVMPSNDGIRGSQKTVDLYTKLAQPFTVIQDALLTACPNYNPPADTPAP